MAVSFFFSSSFFFLPIILARAGCIVLFITFGVLIKIWREWHQYQRYIWIRLDFIVKFTINQVKNGSRDNIFKLPKDKLLSSFSQRIKEYK